MHQEKRMSCGSGLSKHQANSILCGSGLTKYQADRSRKYKSSVVCKQHVHASYLCESGLPLERIVDIGTEFGNHLCVCV